MTHYRKSTDYYRLYEQGRMPEGSGIVALGTAYDSYENCEIIAKRGRVPVIKPADRKDRPGGFSTRSRMLEWLRDRPGESMRAYGRRNPVESVFSAMRDFVAQFDTTSPKSQSLTAPPDLPYTAAISAHLLYCITRSLISCTMCSHLRECR